MRPPRFPDGSEDVQRKLAACKTLGIWQAERRIFTAIHGPTGGSVVKGTEQGIATHTHERKKERLH